jgi:Subtilase family
VKWHRTHGAPLVVVAIAGLLLSGPPAGATTQTPHLAMEPAPAGTLARLAQEVGGAGASSADPRFRFLRKLDSHLQDVAASGLGAGSTGAATAALRQGVALSPGGDVPVDVYVNGDVAQAAAALRALGMQVTATSDREPERMVEGLIAPDLLAAAATLGSTHAIVATSAAAATGSVTSQGDAAINGPEARLLGPTGAGVSVGIISDSIDEVGGGIAASQATGDLPADVQDLLEPAGGTDEGRAMGEIVYDEAPGISAIDFSTGFIGAATKAASIDNLVAAGDKVIADDIYYNGEPFFQDDIIAEAVDRAKAAGVAYFALAGNESDNSWQSTYSPVADPTTKSATTEDFDPSSAVDTIQSLGTIPLHGTASVSLQWAEPWGHATDDFALDVYSIIGGVPSFAFTVDSDNIASGIPLEFAQLSAVNGAVEVGIAIRHVSGTGTPILKFIDYTDGAFPVTIEHPSPAGAIDIDAGSAKGALTVAASTYSTPTTAETFSSRGPVTRYFDVDGNPLSVPEVLQKPNIAAPDGVATSLPSFSPFFGTSAAAPAAAGIAALIRSAKPAMPVDEVYAIMTDPANALDCSAPGNPDNDCGIGFDLADRSVAMAEDSTPPVVAPSVFPPTPDGPNGWYHGPVTVTWSVSDPDSPVVDLTGCGSTVLGDTAGPVTCSATSAGGTTVAPAAVKRDSTPPTAPVITGIASATYLDSAVPSAAAIGCNASDPTSGIDSCTVTGYDASVGVHQLTAVATDDAGLTSTGTLSYAVTATPAPAPLPPSPPPPPVVKPDSISKLVVSGASTLGTVVSAGIPLTLNVATPSTRVVVKVVAMLPRTKGHASRKVTLGALTKHVGEGMSHLKFTLSAKAKRMLKGLTRVSITISVSGGSADSRSSTLQRSLVLRR